MFFGLVVVAAAAQRSYDNHPIPRCKRAVQKPAAQAALDAARREVGLPTPGQLYRYWDAFFDMMSPQCAVFGAKGHCVLFVPIFKAANDQIRGSLLEGIHALQEAQADEYGYYVTIDHSSCFSHERHPPPMPKWSHLPYLNDVCYRSIFTFTFAREPLTHFLAGYGEFVWRVYAQNQLTPDVDKAHRPALVAELRRRMRADKNDPAGLLGKILDGSMVWEHNEELHMGLMSGAFNNAYGAFDFVGSIATLETDFAHVLAMSKLDDGSDVARKALALRAGVGAHDSSLDELQARKDMKALLATNHSLRRALCHIISPDYHCFAYDFRACLNGSALDLRA